jgi:hypothetical protein
MYSFSKRVTASLISASTWPFDFSFLPNMGRAASPLKMIRFYNFMLVNALTI